MQVDLMITQQMLFYYKFAMSGAYKFEEDFVYSY